ncbi:class I SAM-dependent methyltransferase [Agrobacterium vitis]|uniref:class I SAM-dependent methyltransferase n=2 Tax=Agrobacterium vitis TaxID=373 RepID=UPI001573FC81|nr:class I SAM-dependent methyltransferase [Agrobacterium vitis]NSZ47995.1 class I SAM-dependent methyltransferase [Agrobacterium vitis]UJL72411.1 class I SAM-dependent methyltransferase [Agrobacterium vitis]UJL72855.1 class I SAM-dependent methyltransferase [Agrobacterium vitis]
MDEIKTFHLGSDRPSQRVEETSIKFDGNFDANALTTALRHAFFQAWRIDSKLPLWVRQMEGGSGRKYRYFVNNLFEQLPGSRYLEIGVYKGSTLCAAAYKNDLSATCIDHWKEFGGKDEFDEHARLLKLASPKADLTVIDNDFRNVDYKSLKKNGIFCFDGPHSEQDHYDGITLALPALKDEFILIIDDWVMPSVKDGTHRAIARARLDIVASITIETTQDNTLPTLLGSWFSDWHNGYFLAVVRK